MKIGAGDKWGPYVEDVGQVVGLDAVLEGVGGYADKGADDGACGRGDQVR